MNSVRKSLFISLGERYITIALNLVSFFVLARLLTPEDIGLFSVSAAFIGLAQVMRDFGVGSYLIQEKELTDDRKRTAFTVTLIISGAMLVAIQLIASPISQLYGDPRVAEILSVLAFSFLLLPFNSVTLALLRRDMKFNVLFWINISATLVETLIAISLAVNGFGYMSLVWAVLANAVTICLVAGIYKKDEFWMWPTLKEWRRVTQTGAKFTLTAFTNEFSSKSSDIFAGKLLGFEAVGLISRAMGVMYLFHRDITSAIRGVVFPAFAKMDRDGADMEKQYVYSVVVLTSISFLFYGFFSVFSLEALRLMFGPQWDLAAPLVIWFCIAGAIGSTGSFIPSLLMARGEASLLVRLHLTVDPLRIIAFFVVLYMYKTSLSYAIVFLVFFTISIPIMYFLKGKVQPTNFSELSKGVFQSFLVCGVSILLTYICSRFLLSDEGVLNPIWLIPLGLLAATIWAFMIAVVRHPLSNDPLYKKILSRIGVSSEQER